MAEYIEKQAALDAILREPPDAHYPSWYAERIKALPAADVVPVVHGRWKLLHAGDWTRVCNCSVCGQRETVVSTGRYNSESRMAKIYPYCHCGARMDGGADNA